MPDNGPPEKNLTKKSLLQAYPKRFDVTFFLVASTLALWAGLSLPVLTVRKIWEKNTFTILAGIENLYKERQYFLAFIVFFFSIVFPIVKLGALCTIWFFPMKSEKRERILHWLAILGKWSMLDVFIVAVLIVSVKLGVLASANAEDGVYYFGVAILLAMAATAAEERLAKKVS